MMIIAVDHDEVLFPLVEPLADWHNRRFGTELTPNNFASYRFWEAWGGTREGAIYKYFEYVNSDDYMAVEPITNACEVLQRLKDNGHTLITVTTNQDEIIARARERIKRHFPNIFTGIYNTNHYSLQGASRTKLEICIEQKADCLIDDSLSHLVDCQSILRQVILFGDYPWNVGSFSGIPRAYNWRQAEHIINTGA